MAEGMERPENSPGGGTVAPGREGKARGRAARRVPAWSVPAWLAAALCILGLGLSPFPGSASAGGPVPPGAAMPLETRVGTLWYTHKLTMEASAYYPGPESTGRWADGITATGLAAGHGIVAVDPEVVPLGAVLFIPGYGLAIAGDVGTAIKGDKIDLCFDSYLEAIMFGRRPVEVYILEPQWVQAAGHPLIPREWLEPLPYDRGPGTAVAGAKGTERGW